ncbi:MAG: hypothetical protein AB7P35_17800 [Hyphomonadaceae bacterium]
MSAQRFIWLYDRLTELEMSGVQIAVMFVLIAREEIGLPPITKAELGALVGIGERQVTNVLAKLQGGLKLIEKQRSGGVGKGRGANRYVVRADATGNPMPATQYRQPISGSRNKQPSAGTPLPVAPSNRQPSSGSQPGNPVPVACGEVAAPCISTGARAQKLTLNTTSQLYPERAESSFESEARAREMRGGGVFQDDWTLSDEDRAYAHGQGLLNGSVDVCFAMFGAHHLSKHTISANWRGEWRKWVLRQAHDPRFQTQQPKDQTHDPRHRAAATGRGATTVRAKRDPVFDRLLEDLEPDDQPLEFGRVESYPIA